MVHHPLPCVQSPIYHPQQVSIFIKKEKKRKGMHHLPKHFYMMLFCLSQKSIYKQPDSLCSDPAQSTGLYCPPVMPRSRVSSPFRGLSSILLLTPCCSGLGQSITLLQTKQQYSYYYFFPAATGRWTRHIPPILYIYTIKYCCSFCYYRNLYLSR
jgi:hypothetical protein